VRTLLALFAVVFVLPLLVLVGIALGPVPVILVVIGLVPVLLLEGARERQRDRTWV
jgi:hypothetical protein